MRMNVQTVHNSVSAVKLVRNQSSTSRVFFYSGGEGGWVVKQSRVKIKLFKLIIL